MESSERKAEAPEYDVYVSFNNIDMPRVIVLVGQLEAEGIKVWWTNPDKFKLMPGERFTDIARDAMSRSASCAVLLGESGLGPLQEPEVDKVVLERAAQDKQFDIFPILLPGSNPQQLPPQLREIGWIDFRYDVNDAEVFRQLLSGIWNAKTRGGAVHVREVLDSSPFTERLQNNEAEALDMAGRLGVRAGRLADSALFLAVILLNAQSENPDDPASVFAYALEAQRRAMPGMSTGKIDRRNLLEFEHEYRFDQLPRVTSPDDASADAPREIFITKELVTFLEDAHKFMQQFPIHDSIYTRHILGTILTTSPDFRVSAARERLNALGVDLDGMRKALLYFIEEHEPAANQEKWHELLSPPQAVEEEESPAQVKTAEESILNASVSDQPTADDTLGFDPYVKAIADFLTNTRTEPPLTMSVEGEWGSGKSSFMLQLERELCARVFTPKILMLMRERRSLRIRRERIPPFLRRFRLLHQFVVPPETRRELQKLRCPTVRFNAWRHDKEDALWASFALEFLRKLSGELHPLPRLSARLKLLHRRFRWSSGWLTLLRALIVGLVFISLTIVFVAFLWGNFSEVTEWTLGGLDGKDFVKVLKASGIVGYVAVVLFFVTKLKDFVGDPFAVDLKQFIEAPNYDTHVAFIEHFHEDFKKIVEAYAGRNKVYVFIDDLDRCDVPKAADLMQALNLMITDSPQLIFIMGIDREKVAAGLAVKYEKLLPYLSPAVESAGGAAGGGNGFDPTRGLSYGYSFIEKFIQLPFRIPQPASKNLEQLLNKISPLDDEEKQAALTIDAGQTDAVLAHSGNGQTLAPSAPILDTSSSASGANGQNRTAPEVVAGGTGGVNPPSEASSRAPEGGSDAAGERQQRKEEEELKESIRLAVTRDSLTVRSIVLMVAPTLEYNPRRLKQFINMFRLKSLIAAETGLFRIETGDKDDSQMTLEKLGKFVAIGLKWPRLLDDLDTDRHLLSDLQKWALGEVISDATSQARYWTSHPDSPVLKKLLTYGCIPDPTTASASKQKLAIDANRYSLKGLEIDNLLEVSPRLVRPAKQPTVETTTAAPTPMATTPRPSSIAEV
ncbi:MAG TPA: P-loop NTPase fold protein [Pyrinomonadaceae bacterium]|jgi:hypothetical protein